MPAVHRLGDHDDATDEAVGGSPNVYANKKKIHRLGDRDSDGDVAVEGSPNVYANGR